MTKLQDNQIYTKYMKASDTNIKSISAGNNATLTDDGLGNYTLEYVVVAGPLFSDTNFVGYGGTWETSERYAFPSQSGTSMGGGSWIEPFIGVETIDNDGIPASAGETVRVSGTFTSPGYIDIVFYAETSQSGFLNTSNFNESGSNWYVDIDLSGVSGNLKKLAYFNNANGFPMKIDTMEIL